MKLTTYMDKIGIANVIAQVRGSYLEQYMKDAIRRSISPTPSASWQRYIRVLVRNSPSASHGSWINILTCSSG